MISNSFLKFRRIGPCELARGSLRNNGWEMVPKVSRRRKMKFRLRSHGSGYVWNRMCFHESAFRPHNASESAHRNRTCSPGWLKALSMRGFKNVRICEDVVLGTNFMNQTSSFWQNLGVTCLKYNKMTKLCLRFIKENRVNTVDHDPS